MGLGMNMAMEVVKWEEETKEENWRKRKEENLFEKERHGNWGFLRERERERGSH